MLPGFFRRFFIFRNYLIGVVIAASVLTFFAKQYAFFSFDLYITLFIQRINFMPFEQLLLFISWLGNFYQSQISLGLSCLFFLLIKRKDLGIGLFISTVGAVTISEGLKQFVSRPRPDATLINQIETFFRDDSFPSGHVMYYMGFYGFLLFAVFVLVKDKLWRHILTGVLVSLLIFIGVSRIYKGSHWFSDTLASYLVGTIWLYLVVWSYQKLVRKKEIKPKELKLPKKEIKEVARSLKIKK